MGLYYIFSHVWCCTSFIFWILLFQIHAWTKNFLGVWEVGEGLGSWKIFISALWRFTSIFGQSGILYIVKKRRRNSIVIRTLDILLLLPFWLDLLPEVKAWAYISSHIWCCMFLFLFSCCSKSMLELKIS